MTDKKYTSEEIKNRLSNIGEMIGTIALEYIAELEKENEQLKERLGKANIVAKILETTEDNFEEVFYFEKLKELLGDTNDKI